jgi:hypothetical protein
MILCTCELNRNWSLFLITNKGIENIYWGIELEGYLILSIGADKRHSYLNP